MLAKPHPDILMKEGTALLVIDMQPSLFPLVHDKDTLLKNTISCIETAKIFNLPILLTEQYPKGLGVTIPEVQNALPEYKPIAKNEFSCVRNDAFYSHLKVMEGVNTLIVTGIETHICVNQTVLDAMANGYNVHLVADATSARSEYNKKIGIKKMRNAGAVISSLEMLIYELLETKDAKEFKDILKLVKRL
jgi:nicotinamidase-related amidase